MAADRIETRHEPVSIPVSTPNGDLVIPLWPLPWRKKNDLGQLLIASSAHAIEQLRGVIEGTGEDVERDFGAADYASNMDYNGIFEFAFSTYRYDESTNDGSFTTTPPSAEARAAFWTAGEPQMLDILAEALKLNGLERLVWLLDGGSKESLPMIGENVEPMETADLTPDDGPKMESPTDSGLVSVAGQEAQ